MDSTALRASTQKSKGTKCAISHLNPSILKSRTQYCMAPMSALRISLFE